jgi:hypothetical protein
MSAFVALPSPLLLLAGAADSSSASFICAHERINPDRKKANAETNSSLRIRSFRYHKCGCIQQQILAVIKNRCEARQPQS